MCDFHSTCWRLLGQEIQVAHNQNNSHSDSIKEAGWRDNEPNRKINVFEAEWNGEGEMPPDSKLIRNIGECPEKLVKAIRKHYTKLAEALSSGKHVLAGGYFVSEKWVDVLLAVAAKKMPVAFPENVGGHLDLSGLTSAKDLVLPKSVGGHLYLSGLTSAKDLVLPKSIGGYLNLSGLTSAKDLVLPKSIGGSLYLRSLTSADKDALRKKFPHLKNKIV